MPFSPRRQADASHLHVAFVTTAKDVSRRTSTVDVKKVSLPSRSCCYPTHRMPLIPRCGQFGDLARPDRNARRAQSSGKSRPNDAKTSGCMTKGGDNADVSFIRALDSSSPSCRDLPRMSCPGVTPIDQGDLRARAGRRQRPVRGVLFGCDADVKSTALEDFLCNKQWVS